MIFDRRFLGRFLAVNGRGAADERDVGVKPTANSIEHQQGPVCGP